ncbi:hypothetical protein AB0J72_08435 [Dactylosporangium sp. NPDC049742]|uniref:hypothetical protein n=1 Tax=Dactylosporangium sp. NPDC049742 TaxID=3154737 RepID=UPI0034310F8C
MTDPSPRPGARSLGAWVAGLCEELGPRLSPAAGGQVLDVRRRLGEPLADGSALVDALVGRRGVPSGVPADDLDDAVKAGWALASLELIAGRAALPGDRELLHDALDRLLQRPEAHRLRVVQVARLVAAGEVELPEQMAGELLRLALSDDPAWVLDLPGAGRDQLAVAAQQAAVRWRDYARDGAAPPQARAALVAHRGLYVLLQRLRGAR